MYLLVPVYFMGLHQSQSVCTNLIRDMEISGTDLAHSNIVYNLVLLGEMRQNTSGKYIGFYKLCLCHSLAIWNISIIVKDLVDSS